MQPSNPERQCQSATGFFQGFGSITQIENSTNSNYNSLQAGLRMQNKHGLSLQLSYTYSHEIDIQSGDLGSTNQQGSGSRFPTHSTSNYDRGSGTIDQRHVFSANYIYDLPFFLHSQSASGAHVLGGWQISGITAANSGHPVNVTYSPDTLGLGGGTTNRPNLVSPVNYPKKQLAWFNTSAFAAPLLPWAGGTNQGFGTAGKDAITGPGLFNWNLSLFKEFRITKLKGRDPASRGILQYLQPHGMEWYRYRIKTDSNFGSGDIHERSAHLPVRREIPCSRKI